MRHRWTNTDGHPYNQVKLIALYVTISAMKSCYLRTDYCLSWMYVCNGLYPLLHTRRWDSSLSLQKDTQLSFSERPVTLSTFWFITYSIMKLISHSPTFVERISGSIEIFVFNYNCPTMAKISQKRRIQAICTTEKICQCFSIRDIN